LFLFKIFSLVPNAQTRTIFYQCTCIYALSINCKEKLGTCDA
jgi:hypothetical protein